MRSMEYNGLTSWRRFEFQESDKYESSGDNPDVCNRFLIDIRAKRASNLHIDGYEIFTHDWTNLR